LRAEIMRLLSELSSSGILESMRRHSARMA